MPDSKYQHKPNLRTPSPNAVETGEPVDPESACRPSCQPIGYHSIPDESKALWQWAGSKAEYRPRGSQQKPWSNVPENHATGCSVDLTARRTWVACDLAMAYHVVVDRWSQLIRRP